MYVVMDTTTRWKKSEYEPHQVLKPGMRITVPDDVGKRWGYCKIAHEFNKNVDQADVAPLTNEYTNRINQLSQAELRIECQNLGMKYTVTESAEVLRAKLRERI